MSAQLAAHGRLGGGGGGVMEYHPVASLFPLMEGDEFHALVDDIKRNGLIVPITLSDGLILDGRNRYRACQEAGVEPHYQEVSGALNPWSHVWSINATRRHLDPGTHSCCYYEYRRKSSEWLASREQAQAEANRKRSEATKAQPRTEDGQRLASGAVSGDTRPDSEREREKLAEEAGISSATMGRAIGLTKSHPDLAAQVRSGDLKFTEALRQARKERMAEKAVEQAHRGQGGSLSDYARFLELLCFFRFFVCGGWRLGRGMVFGQWVVGWELVSRRRFVRICPVFPIFGWHGRLEGLDGVSPLAPLHDLADGVGGRLRLLASVFAVLLFQIQEILNHYRLKPVG